MKPAEPECTADLSITANIDKSYVERGEERMDLYRRMAASEPRADADDLLDEIVDRYGEPPRACSTWWMWPSFGPRLRRQASVTSAKRRGM